jgi:DNA-binding transcriptional ArsR family regulator
LKDLELKEAASVFSALGSPARLRLLILVSETDRPLHIKAVANALKIDYAALYRHAKILEKRGLLEVYDVGRSRVLSYKDADLLRKAIEIAKKLKHEPPPVLAKS